MTHEKPDGADFRRYRADPSGPRPNVFRRSVGVLTALFLVFVLGAVAVGTIPYEAAKKRWHELYDLETHDGLPLCRAGG
jgi:hypothetical protein